jgi:3'-phosphoadenosine 5'-phosphosulfate sulfotransferase (PAPS reductase)/FAD synthetase/ferredoxin
MYGYKWERRTRGYRLTTQTGKFVANELRPVFAEELQLIGFNSRFEFDTNEKRPLMWAQRNLYIINGKKVAQLNKIQYGKPFTAEFFFKVKKKLKPVDIEAMINANNAIMGALITDTLKRIKEMYDQQMQKCDTAYIGFSGGKDSVVLLDLCHRVLPLSVPVIFSDTDMELPDTYKVWEKVKARYPDRPFLKVRAETSALENWRRFGPPSQALRWCCSVHKSTPAILALKTWSGSPSTKILAFVGVRGEESQRRSGYEDIGDGLKNKNQVNAMPILNWSSHELFLYIFENDLVLNQAYRNGLPRVGCLLCPMSGDRQTELIRQVYSEEVLPFIEEVKHSSNRAFVTPEDAEQFVFSGGWHARKSGVSLREVIDTPNIERQERKITYLMPAGSSTTMLEWLKTVGKVERLRDGRGFILRSQSATVDFYIEEMENGERVKFLFQDSKPDKKISAALTRVLNKTIGCVGCRACEAECPAAALKFTPSVMVDAARCIRCQNCHSPQEGCLRYFSKRYAGGSSMNISGINKYMTFGLRPEWVAVLSTEREQFRTTHSLGNRMVPSAVTWFREAGLIRESTAIQTTPVLMLGERAGFEDLRFWHLIWMGLANRSPLVKWYVSNVPFEDDISRDEIDVILAQFVQSESVRKGAIQSLVALLKWTPLGKGGSPIVKLDGTKKSDGTFREIRGLRRVTRDIDSLVVLYGIYIMAHLTGRGSFTVREMMTAEFEAPCISPLATFGILPDTFKAQCLGLSSKYPEFINCSFTHGLDEVRVFPEVKTLDNVVELMLGV